MVKNLFAEINPKQGEQGNNMEIVFTDTNKYPGHLLPNKQRTTKWNENRTNVKEKRDTSCLPLKMSGRDVTKKSNRPDLEREQQRGWNQLQELFATLFENTNWQGKPK